MKASLYGINFEGLFFIDTADKNIQEITANKVLETM